MEKKTWNFSPEDVKALAQSPAGQQLLALLQQTDSKKLQAVMDSANAGDYASATQALQKILTPQMRDLAKELRD